MMKNKLNIIILLYNNIIYIVIIRTFIFIDNKFRLVN